MSSTFPNPSAVLHTAANGTKIDLIQSGRASSFAAALSYGVGYSHDRLRDPVGDETPLAPGLVHLTEHVLAKINHETLLEFERHGSLTPRTTADAVIWTLKGAYQGPKPLLGSLDAALGISEYRSDAHAIRRAVEHELPIVGYEGGYRASKPGWKSSIALQSGLFPGTNLGRDPLGSIEDLGSVGLDVVAQVLRALSRALDVVSIVAPRIDQDLAEQIAAVVMKHTRARSTARWTVTAADPASRPPVGLAVLEESHPGPESDHGTPARAVYGFRLQPPERIEPSRRAATALLGEAMRRTKSFPRWQLTRRSRFIGGGAGIEIPWSDDGAAPFAIAEFRQQLVRTFQRLTPSTLQTWVEMELLSRETDLAKLGMARRCGLFDVPLRDVLEIGHHIDPTVMESLLDDLRTAPGTVVYQGPPLA